MNRKEELSPFWDGDTSSMSIIFIYGMLVNPVLSLLAFFPTYLSSPDVKFY